MNEEDVLNCIKRMRLSHLRLGGNPKKITMSRKTFNDMVSEVNELMCFDAGDHPEYTVYGMEIEIRDDVDTETLFIVS